MGKVRFVFYSIAAGYHAWVQIQQLQYFVAVADTGHFTNAAAEVGVSQPALSQQIRALEKDIGAVLLHRARGSVGLTDAGEVLLPIARRILSDSDGAYREIRDLGDLRRGRVRLGATPSVCTGLLPVILAGFRAKYPGVDLMLHEAGSRALQSALAEGSLDLALIIDSRLGADPSLATIPLLVEDLVVVSSLDQPSPAKGSRMAISELKGKPLVMFSPGYDLRDATVGACREAGFEPTLAIEGGEMDAVLEFVGAGIGLAVVPSTVVGTRFRRTEILTPALTRTVHMAHRRDMTLPRAARALQEEVIEYLQEATAAGTLPPGVKATMVG